MCQNERSDYKYAERESLVRKFRVDNRGDFTKCDLKTLLDFEKKINSMYKPDQPYQDHMRLPLAALATNYRAKGDSRRSAETFMRFFELTKDIDNLFAFKLLILACVDYLKSANSNKDVSKVREIIKTYQIGSLDFYKYAYGFDDLTFIKQN